MWKGLSLGLILTAIVCMVATEVIRSLLHRRRTSQDGLGGTQDIAMVGTLVGGALLLAAGICGGLWVMGF